MKSGGVFFVKSGHFPHKMKRRGKSGPALGGTEYRLMPSACRLIVRAIEIVKFTISIPRESCTNAKAKYSSSVVPPDPLVHFYH